jgi:predicted transcriptional regulator
MAGMVEDRMTQMSGDAEMFAKLAADIVSAHVSNNKVDASALPQLVRDVYRALAGIAGTSATVAPPPAAPVPAVPIKASIKPDHLICLEDGKKLKLLKRHLRAHFNLTPEQYRAKWGLPPDYPMVAPNYAARRSELAHAMQLGTVRSRAK